jgi:hypothetical protein
MLGNNSKYGSSLLVLGLLQCIGASVVPRHATVVSRQAANQTTYDFVIAGSGPGGLTVADRLTEDPSSRQIVMSSHSDSAHKLTFYNSLSVGDRSRAIRPVGRQRANSGRLPTFPVLLARSEQ